MMLITDMSTIGVDRSLTTAQLLQRISSSDLQANDLAPLGIALHHFTDAIADREVMRQGELHQATTILTKQVQRCLSGDDWLHDIRALATDPDRPALADGRTAAQVCHDAWPTVSELARRRSSAAIDNRVLYGDSTILKLAALRGWQARRCWWSTWSWKQQANDWCDRSGAKRETRSALLQSPEYVNPEILYTVLHGL